MGKNMCGKRRDASNPYEVWQSKSGQWTWKVLKKYGSPAAEARNPYAMWLCSVSSPYIEGELGNVYVADLKANAIRIS